MSILANKRVSIDTSSGEPEKDANSLLIELDKGLRSAKVGEQCEAVVRFPSLCKKYPFPVLINSAFLKLADAFRVGSNLIRLLILQVTQQSQLHLDKIINQEEFVRRIFQVVRSNDPLARAITIRTLGSAAQAIAERKNVHHSIINGLDSHDKVELEAAIFAANSFSAQSKSFAVGISGKLAEMIEGLSTPMDMKLQLLPIFENMHHDPTTAGRVRELLTNLLDSNPAEKFVLTTLHTLSQLSAKSVIDIRHQVDLLLSYLRNDVRRSVKILALRDLKMLAKKAPHMFTASHIQTLGSFALQTTYEGLQLGTLQVLTCLSSTLAANNFSVEQGSVLLECCDQFCYHGNVIVAATAATLLSDMAKYSLTAKKLTINSELMQNTCTVLESLITVTSSNDSPNNQRAMKLVLQSVAGLCNCDHQLVDRFVETILNIISVMSGESAILLCQCLSAISSRQNSLLASLIPEICDAVHIALASSHPKRSSLLVSLVTLLCQASLGVHLEGKAYSTTKEVLARADGWTAYKIGRQAARYGHHQLASDIFGNIATKVSTEIYHFWLTGLRDCCHAESLLHDDVNIPINVFLKTLSEAQVYYQKGISSVKVMTMSAINLTQAASTPGYPTLMHCELLMLRAKSLQTYVQVVRAGCSFQTSPPPAIAANLALKTGQEVHRCGHVVAQLQKCSKDLDDLCRGYQNLYQMAFDVDPGTLTTLRILQRQCSILMHVLDFVLNRSQSSQSSGDAVSASHWSSEQLSIEQQLSATTCAEVLSMLGQLSCDQSQTIITHQDIECIQHAAIRLCQVPLCLPRSFFQLLQSTNIKLAISPQPRVSNEPITISFDTHLTLKVEGVITHGSNPGLYRHVQAILLSVSSNQQSRAHTANDTKMQENPTNAMTQTVSPHNDYFSGEFLLAFPVAGLHQVLVSAAVKDEDGVVWTIGLQSTLLIKSYDDTAHRQQQNYSGQRQQHRSMIIPQPHPQ